MKLQEYLDAIKKCPDDDLHSRFGIYGSYPVLLSTDCETVLSILYNLKNYKLYNQLHGRKRDYYWFNYNPGTVNIVLSNQIPALFCSLDESEKRR